MFTIFHLLQLFGIIAGIALGAQLGQWYLGLAGAIGGGFVGLLAGFVVGRLPWVIGWAWMRRDLKRSSAGDLRRRLESQYFVSHLIIAELVTRGEPVESFRDLVVRQLNSDSPDVRRFGEANAALWFPELAKAE
jgi:hypothetical protein